MLSHACHSSSPAGQGFWLNGLGALRPAALLSVFGVMALLATGCSSVAGDQEAAAKFKVLPKGDGSFFGWSEITLAQDANSVDGATIGFVRLEAKPPATDVTFLHSVSGEAVTSKERTLLVTKTGMPADESFALMDVVYDGDLRQFFEDGRKIRIEWTGQTNPAFTAWPADGIWVTVTVRIRIE
jgi:hypothetical protein